MNANLLKFPLAQIMLNVVGAVAGFGDDALSIASTFLTLDELQILLQQQPVHYIVDGLLPADDVHVAVGDSGLGKTAWAYQLGLCVATGVPFLGMNVRQGRVLYVDMENGREEILRVSRSLCSHLGIEPFPRDFRCGEGCDEDSLVRAVAEHEPSLVIIDTLRPFNPQAEKANDEMGKFLQELRTLTREHQCAFLLLHHTRKPGENGVPALEDTPVLEWLLQAAGARSLINQTNTRIAFDRARRAQVDSAFVMKSYVKMKGESGPVYIERVCDCEGEPIGYKRIVGIDLLGNFEQQAALTRLPEHFTFKQAKQIYGRSDDPTRKWLLKCESVGLVSQTGHGHYSRIQPEARVDRE